MTVVSLGEILQLPLFLKQGSDITVDLTVVDALGQPIRNPSGWTVKGQIRVTPTGPLLFEWNTTSGPGLGTAVLVYDPIPDVSTLTLGITRVQSLLFTWGSALWDCFLTSPAGQSACVVEGTVAVEPAITQ